MGRCSALRWQFLKLILRPAATTIMWVVLLILLHVPVSLTLNVTASYSERQADTLRSTNLLDTLRTTYQFFDVQFSEDVFINANGTEFCPSPVPEACNQSSPSCAGEVSNCTSGPHQCLSLGSGILLPVQCVSSANTATQPQCRTELRGKDNTSNL